jgi:co-chaperonin GroES (HSP10)
MTHDEFVAKHFPEVDCGREPLGNKITVQLQLVRKKKGSIILAGDTQDFNKHSTLVCRVVKIGHIAFKNRDSGETWKEGAWASVGDIVLMPRYGGMNRVEIPFDEDESVIFTTYNDFDVVDKVTGQFEHYTKLL